MDVPPVSNMGYVLGSDMIIIFVHAICSVVSCPVYAGCSVLNIQNSIYRTKIKSVCRRFIFNSRPLPPICTSVNGNMRCRKQSKYNVMLQKIILGEGWGGLVLIHAHAPPTDPCALSIFEHSFVYDKSQSARDEMMMMTWWNFQVRLTLWKARTTRGWTRACIQKSQLAGKVQLKVLMIGRNRRSDEIWAERNCLQYPMCNQAVINYSTVQL